MRNEIAQFINSTRPPNNIAGLTFRGADLISLCTQIASEVLPKSGIDCKAVTVVPMYPGGADSFIQTFDGAMRIFLQDFINLALRRDKYYPECPDRTEFLTAMITSSMCNSARRLANRDNLHELVFCHYCLKKGQEAAQKAMRHIYVFNALRADLEGALVCPESIPHSIWRYEIESRAEAEKGVKPGLISSRERQQSFINLKRALAIEKLLAQS